MQISDCCFCVAVLDREDQLRESHKPQAVINTALGRHGLQIKIAMQSFQHNQPYSDCTLFGRFFTLSTVAQVILPLREFSFWQDRVCTCLQYRALQVLQAFLS